MFLSRMLAIACCSLATASVAQAADPAAFSVLLNDTAGKPMMFQSATALKKGDVIKISSFNAQPVMILQIAMCNSDCPAMHLVKTISLTPYWRNVASTNQNFVVPEDGHVSFWVQRLGGVADIPVMTRNHTTYLQIVDPLLSFATPELYPNTPPMAVSSVQVDDSTLLARFYHRTFVTVSLADAN
ncbi:hypothetical protein [Dyella acidiphila]|uniref:Uncharacterized protein n=1 Tax=Dyella acidiphila TaxID=2775866 RepID=A0ABR9GF62_9GAMM|nr:hypothetical protein [Dyella acidiphila]MBE1162687.1 hypothetical protein [Dyella acidiphila]